MQPIYRIEEFLNAIVNGLPCPLTPIYRIETYLAKLCGADVAIPNPIYRIETYLAKLCGMDVAIPNPIYRIEQYLAAACGMDVEIPTPIYRIETWLYEMASDYPWDTFSGNIIQFTAKKAHAVQSCVAEINPVQDLNGYDAPWPAGGGKNLDPQNDIENNSKLWGTNKPEQVSAFKSLQAGTYTFSCKFEVLTNPDSEATIQYGILVRYSENGEYVTIIPYHLTTAPATVGAVYQYSKTFTINESLASKSLNAYFYCGTGTTKTTANAYDIQIESGSTATDYEPYSNICPISGHTEVNVWNDPKYGGKIEWNQMLKEANIVSSYSKFGLTFTRVTGKSGLTISGTFSYVSGDRNAYIFSSGINVPIVANHVYYASTNSAYANVYMYGATFTNNYLNNVPHGGSIVKASNSANLNMSLHYGSNIANNTEINETVYFNLFDLTEMFGESVANDVYAMDYANKGSGVAWFRNLFPSYDYEYNTGTETLVSAVNGDPYWNVSVSLGQTVYGGSLNVTTGVLTVDRAYDTAKWSGFSGKAVLGSYTRGYMNLSSQPKDASPNDKCNLAPFNGAWSGDYLHFWCNKTNSLGYVYLPNDIDGDTDVEICYELATPLTVQLTAQQVEALKGQNTMWADTGDLTVIARGQ